jgi:hypothetical protein
MRPSPRLCVVFRKVLNFMVGDISPPPNPQAGGTPTVDRPRLLVQYIRSYPPYLDAVSIHKPMTRHAVVTVDPLNMKALSYLIVR